MYIYKSIYMRLLSYVSPATLRKCMYALVDVHFLYVEWLYSRMNLPVPQISRLPNYSNFLIVSISVGLAPIISKVPICIPANL